MNCEQLFEIATQPPPCDADTRREIDVHLAGCADCRRLVDAISPALALFADSRDEFASREPGLSGGAHSSTTRATGVGREVRAPAFAAAPAGDESTMDDRAPLRSGLMSVAATLLIGMMLGGWLQRSGGPETAAPASANSRAMQADQSFQLTSACVQQDAQSTGARLICCTSCHAADKPNPQGATKINLTSLLASCQACHER